MKAIPGFAEETNKVQSLERPQARDWEVFYLPKNGLSKLSDVTYNTIIKIESGATYNPRVETLKNIADALKVSIDDLMK